MTINNPLLKTDPALVGLKTKLYINKIIINMEKLSNSRFAFRKVRILGTKKIK